MSAPPVNEGFELTFASRLTSRMDSTAAGDELGASIRAHFKGAAPDAVDRAGQGSAFIVRLPLADAEFVTEWMATKRLGACAGSRSAGLDGWR